jgi:peptidoglycan endopeptidase LytE
LSKWHNPEEKKLFVKVATAFLGAPYRWGGVSLRGLDCSAFVKKIYELFDVTLPRTAREQAYVGTSVAREDMIEGDLVFFNTKRSFGHVGIYIGNNEFVHASSGNRVVKIDNLNESYFNKRFVKAVRLKGLDEEVL